MGIAVFTRNPYVVQVGHHYSAPLACFVDALDTGGCAITFVYGFVRCRSPPLAFPRPNTRKGNSCQPFSIQLYAIPPLAQLNCFLI